ncbi:serine hydrolase domain-containing protein [Planctobacterium marinum]|uniref:serine hydrolase domain-containing protein n=1 Tax=Planctobacterium marinum TaxID=1631968 RepID=UPI001E4EEC76|nr:serine hydrolase domain-containing protein [Planctobacterium marinum]MCC2605816.1 beta-lactamase family protein [Planctobacterium marinum]
MNFYTAVILGVVLTITTMTQTKATEHNNMNLNRSQLSQYLDALNQNHKAMSAVYISVQGQPVFEHYAGSASVANRVPLSATTRFRIGSVTKTYTAVLVMQAIEQQKLRLDSPLSRYFPDIPNADGITIQHLLNHRSGIHSFTDEPDYPTYMTKAKTQAEMLDIIVQYPADFEPDERHAYSNSNYVLLGYILESVYQKPLANIIAEHLSEPQQFTATLYGDAIDSETEASSYYYADGWQLSPETHLSIPHGAGAMVSTAKEANQFISRLFQGKLVSDDSLQAMIRLQDGYGFGLYALPFHEHTFLGHNGSIDGFLSANAYNPEDDVAITVLSNAMNYSFNDILIAVLSSLYGKELLIPDFSAKAQALNETTMTKLTGDFSSEDLPLDIRVFIENQKLMAQASGQGAFPLTAYSELEFRFDPAGIVIKYDADSLKSNKFQRFTLIQGGGKFLYNMK